MARAFTSQSTPRITIATAASLLDVTNASIMCWFKHTTGPTSGEGPRIYEEFTAFDITINVLMRSDAANQGKIECMWRTPAGVPIVTSPGRWDDDVWHRLLVVRRSTSPFLELYLDGASQATSTTDPGTDATIGEIQVGNKADGVYDASWGGSIARFFTIERAMTAAEADGFLIGGLMPPGQGEVYLELMGGSPEPDWSGRVRNGTLTGTTFADHAPCASPMWVARYSRYAVAVAAAVTRRRVAIGAGYAARR